jgi:hypothetical protein
MNAPPLQSSPSTRPQLAAPGGGDVAHVPSVLPVATLQVPVQQSAPVAHASPGCAQNDDAWHVPLEHRPEQHVPLDEHALPIVLHVALRVAHLPPVHVWLQHSPFVAHAVPSEWHCG